MQGSVSGTGSFAANSDIRWLARAWSRQGRDQSPLLCCTLVVMLELGQEQEFISAKTDPG